MYNKEITEMETKATTEDSLTVQPKTYKMLKVSPYRHWLLATG